MLWGCSEVCDLYEEYRKHVKGHVIDDADNTERTDSIELNVLLFGSGDPRHIIKAMAKNYQHQVKLNFFIFEGCASLIARHMLLLSIVLEPPESLTPMAKTHLFMDIYGNSLIRSTSIGYINSKVNHLIKCITDSTFNAEMQPQFDFTQLRYIERDMLECVLKFWTNASDRNGFDISRCWTERNRQTLRDRFDARHGVYDWDHQMRLKENGAQQICSQEYGHWRETGIAFTFPEYRQSHTNKTFALEIPCDRTAQSQRYIGDMTNGPFCTFGLACDNKSLLRSNHGQNEYRATDITEYNLFEQFYEIHEQKPFDTKSFSAHKLGATKINTGKILDADTMIDMKTMDLKRFNRPTISTPNIHITFLSINDALCDGKKFRKYFDIVFIGRNYFPIIKKEFSHTFKSSALILFETAQLSVQRKPEIAEFLQKIRNINNEMHLKPITHFNINTPIPIAKFINTDLV